MCLGYLSVFELPLQRLSAISLLANFIEPADKRISD